MLYTIKIGGNTKEYDKLMDVYKKYLSITGSIEDLVEGTIDFLQGKKVNTTKGQLQLINIKYKDQFEYDAEDIFIVLKREVKAEEIKKRIDKNEAKILFDLISKAER